MRLWLASAALAWLVAPAACQAADAAHPYSSVDPRVDAGNNTGDDQVEILNQAQLDRLAMPPRNIPGASAAGAFPPLGYYPPPQYAPAPQYAPMPRYYYPPPPFYYGVPPGYYPPPAYGPPPGPYPMPPYAP